MRASIFAIGETLIDIVETPSGATERPGGSSFNVAVGLARLGHPVELITSIGSDARGAAALAYLSESGVRVAPTSLRGGVTSTALASIGPDGAATYRFDFDWPLLDIPLNRVPHIVHTGSLGAFVEPGGTAVTRSIERIAEQSIVTFDPNVRPTLFGERSVAIGRFMEIAKCAAVVKMSDEDADWLFPNQSLLEVIRGVLDAGPALVVITRGANGSRLASRQGIVDIPAPRTTVLDTVGAGDSFMAALIGRIAVLTEAGVPTEAIRNGAVFGVDELRAIGEYCARCAAITCSRVGADPPTADELTATSPKVRG